MASNLQELCVELLGAAVKTHLEPKCNNLPLWDNGLGRLARGLVEASVPAVTGDMVAEGALQMMGVRRRPPSPYRASAPGQGPVIDVNGRRV
jgi:hypothetical protein